MSSYELKYFNLKGRAEIVRITLAAAGQDFKDTRYEFADWPSYKESIPGKALPVIIVDGKKIYTQSMAIARYLAKLYGLYGKSDLDGLLIDETMDCLLDIFTDLVKIKFCPENMKEELTTKYKATCARILEYLESKLQTGKHHFIGDKLSLADIATFVILESPISKDADLMKKYPKLVAVRENVSNIPTVAAYLKKRPVTDF